MLQLRGHPNVLVGDEVVNDQGARCAMNQFWHWLDVSRQYAATARRLFGAAAAAPSYCSGGEAARAASISVPACQPLLGREGQCNLERFRIRHRLRLRRAAVQRQRLARRAAAAWTWTPRRTACRWSRPRQSRPSPAARRFRRQLPPMLHWPYGKGYSDHPEVPECFHDGGALGAGARYRSIRTDAVGRSPYRNTGESLAMRYPTRLWDESVVRPDPILDLLVSSQLTPPYTLAHLAHDGTSCCRRQQYLEPQWQTANRCHERLRFGDSRQLVEIPGYTRSHGIGGEGGIRTLDGLSTHTHFPGVLLKPLGHLSDGGDHISHTPAPEFAATVAPFRAWRG